MSFLSAERAVAIAAVLQASRVCQKVFQKLVTIEAYTKSDKSPVTVADFSSQAIISTFLHKNFPNDPIVGEEDSDALHGESGKALRDKVLSSTNSVLDEPLDEQKLFETLDRGSYSGGAKGIDGTKGFLRGGQYAVCLGLIIDGHVQLGVTGCPNLPVDFKEPTGEKGCLFVAVRGQGAFQVNFSSLVEKQISLAEVSSVSDATFCESVEEAHSSHGEAAQIASLLGITKPSIRMDSQCKYCSIARGDTDILLRLPVIRSLLIHEAGGVVSDINGKPLDFSLGRTLKNNKGVVVAHSNIHSQVIKAVQQVLFSK
ncbi:6539_t:CDS:2 [Diversispora eburnea]|uniref:3'(2'),5'-bisphosphate nucleotidase n=1 Tax=Diversispora eburnea TaxID=1213867 RepID=A0A9N8V2A6_9GLOM|nr:6539_t:CDS:2 [Diversispora eburnea]